MGYGRSRAPRVYLTDAMSHGCWPGWPVRPSSGEAPLVGGLIAALGNGTVHLLLVIRARNEDGAIGVVGQGLSFALGVIGASPLQSEPRAGPRCPEIRSP